MAAAHHVFTCSIAWTGNRGSGTSSYKAYGRDYVISAPGKPPLPGSSAPEFRGDADRYNPEDLLVAALSSCHMLWYLHLAADAGIVVTGYSDAPAGIMETAADGGGQFTKVTLRPHVTLAAGSDESAAAAVHEAAHEKCFIARSVNFPIVCEPTFERG